ncbi:MAG TPA: hypothetical protein DEA47_02035 [Peptococcaceae bacterium]|nr:MAG: hypothetical protein XD50_0151 [Clostridia bacterium 41_269]HBT20139.1 hypothetical protein [Peptococcaceae bacterium]
MSKTVLGIFSSERVAEEAVNDLRQEGFDREISILAKERKGKGEGEGEEGLTNAAFETADNIADGTTSGGVLGALAGLAAGAGALAIPGLGPVVAAGPISGLLAGAATGGIAGGLLDWGIPEEEGREIEQDIKEGNVLVAVNTSEDKADRAEQVLRNHGAKNIKIHEKK